MQVRSVRRIDSYWLGVFGTAGDESREPVVTAHRCNELAGYPGVYCVLRHGQAFISAPSELVEPINGFGATATTVINPTWWRHHLPTWQTFGPSVHAFTDLEPQFVQLAADVKIQRAPIDDLADLQAAVPAAEWAESGFAGRDIAKAWRATTGDDTTVAAANLTPFDGAPSDVGVLARPGFRGRGLAAFVAAAAVHHAVRHHRLARWRAHTTNTPSLRLADTLGFDRDCLQLAARPPTDPLSSAAGK